MADMVKNMVVYRETTEGGNYTSETSLARHRMLAPDKINPSITWLQGRGSDAFPLTFLTEGQPGGVKGVNNIEYEKDIYRKPRKSSAIKSHSYSGGDTPGAGGSPIFVNFVDEILIRQHTVNTPNGYAVRVQDKKMNADGSFRYEFALISDSESTYLPLTELEPGTLWAMVGAPMVANELSLGNSSNRSFPGKAKGQISILRKSHHIAGNTKYKMVEVSFDGKSKLWMPWEEWNFELEVKAMNEEHYWYSQYNRLPDGRILLKDPDNGLPIPSAAGIDYQIPNRDTFSFLTTNKLKRTVGDIFYGAPDMGKMLVTLYTGLGGMEDFHNAVMSGAGGFASLLSGGAATEFVKRTADGLSFGNYFKVYEHVDGHTIIVKHLSLLDHGGRAENAPKHPISGKPLTSHDMYFIDQSTYEGVRNIQMVTQNGRGFIRGILKGMAAVPDFYTWKGNDETISTEQDKSSLHLLFTKAIDINRPAHCFKLSCELS